MGMAIKKGIVRDYKKERRISMLENQDIEFKTIWKDGYLKWICGMMVNFQRN